MPARVGVPEPMGQDELPLLFRAPLEPDAGSDGKTAGPSRSRAPGEADDAAPAVEPEPGARRPCAGRRRLTWSRLFIAVELLLLAGAVSGLFGAAEPTGILLISVLSLGAMVYAIRRFRPSLTWPWWIIAGALFIFIVGALVRADLQTLGNLTTSRSLLPDLISLPGYVVLAVGLTGSSFARAAGRERPLGVFLDGVIAALALLAMAWVFLLEPLLLRYQTPMPVRLILGCYPAMSIFLLVFTFRIAFSPDQERRFAYWALLWSMTCMFIGDSMYMFTEIGKLEIPGRFLDFPYALAYVGAAAMALHPSMRDLTEPSAVPRLKPSAGRIMIVAAALLVPTLLVLYRPGEPLRDRFILFTITIALAGAAVLRIVQALHVAERSEAPMAHQAMHDSLTGLPNRRMVHQHLTQCCAGPRLTTPTWRCCSSTSTGSSWSTTPWGTHRGTSC